MLLEHKADPNVLCDGMTALAIAISVGNDKVANALLKRGAGGCGLVLWDDDALLKCTRLRI